MMSHLRPTLVMLGTMTLLTGLAYPLALTELAGALAPEATRGSLIEKDGRVVGSSLIGQKFTGPGFLHPRPSASDWNAAGTSASNLGPTSAALVAAVAERRAAYEAENGSAAPIDAATASASGLDPHISPENAEAQVQRIAGARGADPEAVRRLIAAGTEPPFLGLYGLPRVNVLAVNLELDETLPASSIARN